VIGALNSSTLKPLVDKVVQEQYSPGSTFKIITSIAAASEGVIGLDDVFYCDLQWDGTKHGDKIRYDWRKTDKLDPTGDVVLSQALTASCDPFFYEMGARLYEKNPTGNLLASYAQRLGLGTPLGILGLDQSEAPGNLAPPDNITSAVNDAIGQGNVQIPPIQMAQMVAAVANGGTLYKTYLVQQIGGMDGAAVTFQAQPQIVRQLNLRPEVIQAVQDGMCQVTTNRKIGTAEFVFGNAPYGVCGKTGTAQTAYYPNGWFVAYAMPTRDSKPELAIAVMVANSREGSEVAGPIVRRILDIYYNAKKVIDYPDWWNQGPYHPLEIPEGGTGGG
jgi:penicillin-binding protein 2